LKRALFWRMKFRIKLSSKKRRKKWARSRKNLWLSLPWLKNPNKFSSWCLAFRKHLARNKSRQNYFSEAPVMASHVKFSISSVIIRDRCSRWLKQARAFYVEDLALSTGSQVVIIKLIKRHLYTLSNWTKFTKDRTITTIFSSNQVMDIYLVEVPSEQLVMEICILGAI
jgi:hypothetical protein